MYDVPAAGPRGAKILQCGSGVTSTWSLDQGTGIWICEHHKIMDMLRTAKQFREAQVSLLQFTD